VPCVATWAAVHTPPALPQAIGVGTGVGAGVGVGVGVGVGFGVGVGVGDVFGVVTGEVVVGVVVDDVVCVCVDVSDDVSEDASAVLDCDASMIACVGSTSLVVEVSAPIVSAGTATGSILTVAAGLADKPITVMVVAPKT